VTLQGNERGGAGRDCSGTLVGLTSSGGGAESRVIQWRW
jgi:hypothetical protein